jgi:PIN like domain
MPIWFPDHDPDDPTIIEPFLQKCIVVLDTNAWFAVYRLDVTTSEEFLKTLESLQAQRKLSVPYQVFEEFARNRNEVVETVTQSFEQFIEGLQKEFSKFKSSKPFTDHPNLIPKEFDENLKKAISDIRNSARKQKDNRKEALENGDNIYPRLRKMMDETVGKPFIADELVKLHATGKQRYKEAIPPGYGDGSKQPEARRYGDFLLWEQVIQFAKEKKIPILLVTSDNKEDWFEIGSKGIKGRSELYTEFYNRTQQYIWIVSVNRFVMELVTRLNIGVNVSEELKKEIVILEADQIDYGRTMIFGNKGFPMELEDFEGLPKLENGKLPENAIEIPCFLIQFNISHRHVLVFSSAKIIFDPSKISYEERRYIEEFSPSAEYLIATSGADQHSRIMTFGASIVEINEKKYRALLINDKYNHKDFFPTVLIPLE